MRYLLLILLCGSLFAADDCCEPAVCCEPSGCFSFGAEWLYMMPAFDQSEFLWDGSGEILTDNNAIADRVGEKQRYYSAYRIEGSYLFCNQINAIIVRYTNFHKNYFTKLFSNLGSQILGIPEDDIFDDESGSVAFDRDYRYYNIEGLFSLYKTSFCRFSPTFLAGIKFAHLHIKENALYSDNADPDRQFVQPDMRAWALGPCFEFDGLYRITSCLDFTGRVLLGVLADQNRSKTTIIGGPNNDQANSELLIKNTPKFWHVTRSTDVRLGMSITRENCCISSLPCFSFYLEGGYEMLTERRFISRIYNVDDASEGFSFNEWSDFTLNGPYLKLNLVY